MRTPSRLPPTSPWIKLKNSIKLWHFRNDSNSSEYAIIVHFELKWICKSRINEDDSTNENGIIGLEYLKSRAFLAKWEETQWTAFKKSPKRVHTSNNNVANKCLATKSNWCFNWIRCTTSFPHEKRQIDNQTPHENNLISESGGCKFPRTLDTYNRKTFVSNKQPFQIIISISHNMWVMRLQMIEIGSFRCWSIQMKVFSSNFVSVNNHSALFEVITAVGSKSAVTLQIRKSSYKYLGCEQIKEIHRIECNLKVLYCFFSFVRGSANVCKHSHILTRNLLCIIKIS